MIIFAKMPFGQSSREVVIAELILSLGGNPPIGRGHRTQVRIRATDLFSSPQYPDKR